MKPKEIEYFAGGGALQSSEKLNFNEAFDIFCH